MADGAGGYGGRCMHGADRRTGSPPVGRTSRQADGRMSGWAWVKKAIPRG